MRKIFILMLLFFLLQLFFIFYFKFLLWDEAVYMCNARSYLGYGNYVEEFRFPLLSRVLALVFSITGESLILARVFVLIFSFLSLLFLYKISKKITKDKKIITISLLSLITFFPFFFYSTKVYTDVPAMCFSIISFYFFIEFIESKTKKSKTIFISLVSLFSILAFLTRFSTAIFMISYLIFLISKKQYKNFLKLMIFNFLFYLPWAIYSWLSFGNPIYHLVAQYNIIKQWTELQPFYLHGFYLLIYAPYILFIPFMLYKEKKKKQKKQEKRNKDILYLIILSIVLNFVYFTFFVNLKDPRYLIQYFFLFSSLICFCDFNFKVNFIKTKRKISFISIFVIILILAYLFLSIYLTIKYVEYANEDPVLDSINYVKDYIKQNKSNNVTIISNLWVYYAYYLNTKAYSFWSDDLDYLIKLHKPEIIIYSNYGQHYEKEILEKNKNIQKIKEFKKGNREIILYVVKAIPT